MFRGVLQTRAERRCFHRPGAARVWERGPSEQPGSFKISAPGTSSRLYFPSVLLFCTPTPPSIIREEFNFISELRSLFGIQSTAVKNRIESKLRLAFLVLKSCCFWVFASVIVFRQLLLLWDKKKKSMAECNLRYSCPYNTRAHYLLLIWLSSAKQLWFWGIFPVISCTVCISDFTANQVTAKQRDTSIVSFYFLLKWILFNRWISLLKSEVITDGKARFFRSFPVFLQGNIYRTREYLS